MPGTEETSLRDDLASAFAETPDVNTIEIKEADTSNLPALFKPKEAVSAPAPTTAPEPPAAEASAATDDEPATNADGTPARDASGRFAPKTPAENQLPAAGPAAQAPVATPAPAALRAPVSWRPEEREGWASVPLAAQQAITRREAEVQQVLNHSADARRFFQGFQQIAAPYQQMFAAEQTNPMQAFDYLLRTAAFLRTGPAREKAKMVADMVQRHSIDVSMLDEELSSMVNGPAPQVNIQQEIQRALAPVVQQLQQAPVNNQRQQFNQQAQQELTAFMADAKNEFIHDVGQDMADLMDLAANRGQQMSLQDAYNRAILAHPTISKILEARRGKQDPAQLTAAALRAKNASASVSDSGAPSREASPEDVSDIRSAMAASIRELSGNR